RGIIRDSTRKVIADNRPSYNLYVTPSPLTAYHREQIAKLMEWTSAEKANFLALLARIPERRRSHLIEVQTDIRREQAAAIETHKRSLPGVQMLVVPVRTYPFGKLGAHPIG